MKPEYKHNVQSFTLNASHRKPFHEFVCPYNLSINGKQIWLDVSNGGLRETILRELR